MKRKIFLGIFLTIIVTAAAVWLIFFYEKPPPLNVNHKPIGDLKFRLVTLTNTWGDTMNATAGTLVVPETRDNAISNHIEIAFGVLKTTNPNPLPPLIYLAGGPGSSGIDIGKSAYFYLFRELRKFCDVILLDVRGTGRSIPNLHCANQLDLPTDITDNVQEQIKQSLIASLSECAQYFKDAGVDLNAYNSISLAEDIEDVRRALNYEQIVLYGTSYGTQLAQVYLRLYPDRVARAVLQGPVSPDLALKSPAAVHTQFERMAELPRQDAKVSRYIPDFVYLMQNVHQQLRENPQQIKIPLMDAVSDDDGAFFNFIFKVISLFKPYWELTLTDTHLQMMVQDMVGRDFWIPRLPEFYYRMQQGDFRTVGNHLRNFRRRNLPHLLLITVNCATSYTEDRKQQVLQEEKQTVLSHFGTSFGRSRAFSDAIGVKPLGDEFLQPISSDIPVLFVAGTLDGRTPLTSLQLLQPRFPNHQTIIVNGAGHHGLINTVIKDGMLEFIRGEPVTVTEMHQQVDFNSPVGYRYALADSLYATLTTADVDSAVALYYRLKRQDAASNDFLFDFRESTLNTLGYRLLNENLLEAAFVIFRLNTNMFPDAFNTWDSLAEAFLKQCKIDSAQQYYQKSLALNFFNGNAYRALREIQSQPLPE